MINLKQWYRYRHVSCFVVTFIKIIILLFGFTRKYARKHGRCLNVRHFGIVHDSEKSKESKQIAKNSFFFVRSSSSWYQLTGILFAIWKMDGKTIACHPRNCFWTKSMNRSNRLKSKLVQDQADPFLRRPLHSCYTFLQCFANRVWNNDSKRITYKSQNIYYCLI